MKHLNSKDLTANERLLWNRVKELWNCSVDRDLNAIDRAIHPRYIGWDNNSIVPHDREFALRSVTDKKTKLIEYDLSPLGISVYDFQVGIVQYRYSAKIKDMKSNIRSIKGRWTEIYLKRNKSWILIGVHGGSEPLKVTSYASMYS